MVNSLKCGLLSLIHPLTDYSQMFLCCCKCSDFVSSDDHLLQMCSSGLILNDGQFLFLILVIAYFPLSLS